MKKLYSLKFKLAILLIVFTSIVSYAQSTISGTVTSAENGETLVGVNVFISGTTKGTTTDANGNYQIEASSGDVLVFSFTGMLQQKITLGAETTVNAVLVEDATTLSDIVVTATRQPIRRIQATTAINSVSIQEIETIRPESFTEAIENTPGITVNNTAGRKGGFNIRGFPGGNVYTTTLIDGLPVSSTSGLSSGTQEFYGIDPNVERIEVVRGAAATLFGRAAGAGAVNIISRVGGTKHQGSFSMTKYSNQAGEGHQFEGDLDYRVDVNFNGPLADNLRYNVGGYIINDSGYKEQWAKDKGAQFRANLDWLISEGTSLRIYGGYLDNQFQNVTDVAWDLEKNELADIYENNQTTYTDPSQLDFDAFGINSDGDTLLDAQTRQPITNNIGDNIEDTRGGNIGMDLNINLGNGWAFNQKAKYQRFNFDDINELGFAGFFTLESNNFRGNIGAKQNQTDFMSETRIQKLIETDNSTHNLSAGVFYSLGDRDRLSLTYFFLSTVGPRPTFSWFGGAPPRGTFTISGTSSHREEVSTALFIGDEMTFNDKLSVNVSLRYDLLSKLFTNNPGKIRSAGIDYDPVTEVENEVDFDDFSGSIGVNYLLGDVSAVYGNFTRAFSLPTVNLATQAPENNEIINSLELGYRSRFGDLTADIALFSTRINNRIAFVFDADLGEFVPREAGSNKILGTEISLTYAPKTIKGLLIRGGVTLQQSEYVDFLVPLSTNSDGAVNADLDNMMGLTVVGDSLGIDVGGNQVQETPKAIFNFNISYNSKYWGADFGGYTYTGLYGDVFNLYESPNFSNYNLGVYLKKSLDRGNEVKLSLRVKNVFDSASPQDLFLSSGNDSVLLELQNNPNPAGRLAWATVQNPRRVLVTLGYSF